MADIGCTQTGSRAVLPQRASCGLESLICDRDRLRQPVTLDESLEKVIVTWWLFVILKRQATWYSNSGWCTTFCTGKLGYADQLNRKLNIFFKYISRIQYLFCCIIIYYDIWNQIVLNFFIKPYWALLNLIKLLSTQICSSAKVRLDTTKLILVHTSWYKLTLRRHSGCPSAQQAGAWGWWHLHWYTA